MKLSSGNDWRKYFEEIGLESARSAELCRYAATLADSSLPVIFSFEHLAALLGRTRHHLASIIFAAEHHYRSFDLIKRRGGTRLIEAPYPSLLECQRWILKNILLKTPTSNNVHSYLHGKSIKTNALVHVGENSILKMDLRDFFHSIEMTRVFELFESFGYASEIAYFLAKLCVLRDRLPQGAATSPMLSNIIASTLDSRLNSLAKSKNLKYSRYADDLVFSGDDISPALVGEISSICEGEGFYVNEEKTRLKTGGSRKIVTGLIVGEKKVSLPRTYKREVRQQVYYIIKMGPLEYLKRNRLSPTALSSLAGRLTFWNSIEPDNPFVRESLPILMRLMSGERNETHRIKNT